MDGTWLATIAGATLIVAGAGVLYYSLRQSGDTLSEDPEAVDHAISSIDHRRLSNVLTEDLPTETR